MKRPAEATQVPCSKHVDGLIAKATTSHVIKVYISCSGNNVAEMARDCIDKQLIEWHSSNGESARRPKILAMEEAFKWRKETGRHCVVRLQLSAEMFKCRPLQVSK